MDGSSWLLQEVVKHWSWIVGLGGTAASAGAGFVGKKVMSDRNKLLKGLSDVQVELKEQRTNCLATLQKQGDRQIELLEKISENQVRGNGLLEGYLKAQK
jgi:hypothetical protein